MAPKPSIRFLARVIDMHFANGNAEKAWKIFERLNPGFLGAGCSRTAYLIRDGEKQYVVKIERDGGYHNGSDNRAEWLFYGGSCDEVQDGLAIPYYCSPNSHVLIMEYIPDTLHEMTRYADEDDAYEMAADAKAFVEYLQQYEETIGNDVHGANIGIRSNGTHAIFDYAGAMFGGFIEVDTHEFIDG
jgi:hypothetical protein